MVRAPCCEKVGVKKGPWTKEEDQILINYINEHHGHGNWRALPKKAGLPRCGKSCRLRWINYLRPDIKRGNFTHEEEQTIIQLHEILGNRWSAIAARLPGRTDNEIKNVWHTNLKKRLKKQSTLVSVPVPDPEQIQIHEQPETSPSDDHDVNQGSKHVDLPPNSPPQSSSYVSSSSVTTTGPTMVNLEENLKMHGSSDTLCNYPELEEDFWPDVVSSEYSAKPSGEDGLHFLFSISPVLDHAADHIHGYTSKLNQHDDMDFWCDLFPRTEQLSELSEF